MRKVVVGNSSRETIVAEIIGILINKNFLKLEHEVRGEGEPSIIYDECLVCNNYINSLVYEEATISDEEWNYFLIKNEKAEIPPLKETLEHMYENHSDVMTLVSMMRCIT
jgi:hypothetical protein